MRDAMSASLPDGPRTMTKERFNPILRFRQPAKRIPEQIVELDHVVDGVFDIVNVVSVVVDRPNYGNVVNHLASRSYIEYSSLKTGCGRAQFMESVRFGRNLRRNFYRALSPNANKAYILTTKFYASVVRVLVLPHVIVAGRQALNVRKELEAEASRAIQRLTAVRFTGEPVLHCRNCHSDQNRRDAADRLYPSRRILTERNLADHAKHSKSDQKSEQYQCHVAQCTCPAEFTFQEIHPISPRWSSQRIRTPSRTGEVT